MEQPNERQTEIIKAFQQTLVEFGYGSLTYEQTVEATRKALRGEVESIIARFIHGWLEDEYADLKPMLESLAEGG